jgi:hypothetical protein
VRPGAIQLPGSVSAAISRAPSTAAAVFSAGAVAGGGGVEGPQPRIANPSAATNMIRMFTSNRCLRWYCDLRSRGILH